MRNALMLLVVVALIIVALGAANGSIAFDFDVVFGTWSAVSLMWIAVVAAVVLLVVGLVAVWLAQTDASRTRRKLEAELQATYERLRAVEARLPEEPQAAPEPAGPQEPTEPPADAPRDEGPPSVAAEDDASPAG